MNLEDFWQENKRWILGCGVAALLFLVAKAVIAGIYTPRWSDVRQHEVAIARQEMFTRAQLATAVAERDQLNQTIASLVSAAHYDLDPKYDLKTVGGSPEVYWASTYGAVRRALLDAAEADNVEFAEDDFQWPSPVERDEIQRALFGVSLVEHTVRTLLAAHAKVTGRDFEAQGLRSIERFRMDRRPRTPQRPRGIRRQPGVQVE